MDAELTRRYANVRAAMAEHELDALIVSGSEYSGFEGSVTYLSGFQIVHRYAYVVVPAEGEPQIVFPTEARYVGEHGTAQLEQVFHDRPGEHIAATAVDKGWRRVGVYGLDYMMTVRDYRALEGPRARAVRRRVRPRAGGEERRRARVRPRERPHQRGRLRGVPRRLRAGEDGRGGDGRGREALRRARLRPPDDEHGPHRPGVRDRPQGDEAGRVRAAVARGRRPGDALGRGLARDREDAAGGRADGRGVRGVPRGGARRRCATARRPTTSTARSRRASPTAATTSATSPATRSG